MEPEIKSALAKDNKANLISLSLRHTSILLFIILSLLGGWVGYKLASEKIVENVEPVLVGSKQLDSNHNTWHLYLKKEKFSLLVPNPYQVVPIDGGIQITDGQSFQIGYEIYYQDDIASEEQAVDFARQLYGTDCEVFPKYPNEKYNTDYEPRNYYVYPPDLDKYPEEREPNNCQAFKTSFWYEPSRGRVLSWSGGIDYLMPIEATVRRDDPYEEVFQEVIYADFIMLDSIRFEF